MKYFLLMGILLVLVACQSPAEMSVVGDRAVNAEIVKLEKLAIDRALVTEDYIPLRTLILKDPLAVEIFEGIDWLLDKSEWEHAQHRLGFLHRYVENGDTKECFGHEMEHISLYLEHNDLERAEEAIEHLDVESWIEHNEKVRKNYPQYYKEFDEIKASALEVNDRLKKADYSLATKEKMEFLARKAPC